ncbi:MAG: ABC transporter permease [Streptosporangiaceae bacterium]
MSAAVVADVIQSDQRGRAGRKRRSHGLGIVGVSSAVVIGLAVIIAVAGPSLAPHDPNAVNLANAYGGSTLRGMHILGFDSQGRDLLSRLLAGARTAMIGPVFVVGLAMLIGTTLAVASAWRGGWFDTSVSAVNDILFAFPGILLAVLATAMFGRGLTAASIALTVAYVPYVARVLRSAAVRERSLQYVSALEVQGQSPVRICLAHIVPNLLRLAVAEATILFGFAMLDLAAISFLGLGVQPPQADWGVMVSEGETGVLLGSPGEAIIAGLAIVAVVSAFNLLGERLADRALESDR